MHTLEATGLTKRFGGNAAVSELDFVARSGESVGLIGPNGSGKTTLFNLLTGFLKPTGGRILWNGDDISGLRPGARARRGLVRTFQEKMVFPRLTVLDNIRFALNQQGVSSNDERAIGIAMERVGLPPATLKQFGEELSWGQCRMLGMGLALILEPKILLLDEPFAGLNRVAAAHVSDVIRTLKAAGMGVIIVEHDMTLLLPLCDRVVVLASGRKLAEGTAENILGLAEVRRAYFGEDADD